MTDNSYRVEVKPHIDDDWELWVTVLYYSMAEQCANRLANDSGFNGTGKTPAAVRVVQENNPDYTMFYI